MPRNILIFSDGTGQAGGLTPDQNISNIYKLYRATRCGPENDIDPREQLTFYDSGLGSQPASGMLFVTRAYRWLHDVVSQATGLGITTNIIDCYAALLRMWQPGDRIFLFGFSRGAYTVRCLASVLSFCGIPTTMADGKTPLFRDANSTRKIAKEAVMNVYAFVGSPKDENSGKHWRIDFVLGTDPTQTAAPTSIRSSLAYSILSLHWVAIVSVP